LFISCRVCGVLVAVIHEDEGVICGAINTKAVSGGVLFAERSRFLQSNLETKKNQSLESSMVSECFDNRCRGLTLR